MKNLDNESKDELDERLDKDIEIIKKYNPKYEMSDEFKEKLKNKMIEESRKIEEKEAKKREFINKLKLSISLKKMVAACACLIIIISGGVFADDITSAVSKVFSNTTKKAEENISKSNYNEINMDYVYDQGIGIKVDYIIIDEENKSFSIAFNIKKENIKDVVIDKLKIYNESENEFFNNFSNSSSYTYEFQQKRNSVNECLNIYRITFKEKKEINDLKMIISKLTFKQYDDDKMYQIVGNWEIKI